MKKLYLIGWVVLLFLYPAGPVFAHKVIIFAWVEDGMIHSESSFGSKRKAKDCVITVVDETGKVIHKGITDQEGNYSFKIPDKIASDIILKLDAGTGHQGQWRIPRDELIKVPTQADIQAAMKEKQDLEKGPSAVKIIGGMAIIFLLAFAVKFIKRKTA